MREKPIVLIVIIMDMQLHLLEGTIASINNQSYENIELHIIDNNSADYDELKVHSILKNNIKNSNINYSVTHLEEHNDEGNIIYSELINSEYDFVNFIYCGYVFDDKDFFLKSIERMQKNNDSIIIQTNNKKFVKYVNNKDIYKKFLLISDSSVFNDSTILISKQSYIVEPLIDKMNKKAYLFYFILDSIKNSYKCELLYNELVREIDCDVFPKYLQFGNDETDRLFADVIEHYLKHDPSLKNKKQFIDKCKTSIRCLRTNFFYNNNTPLSIKEYINNKKEDRKLNKYAYKNFLGIFVASLLLITLLFILFMFS